MKALKETYKEKVIKKIQISIPVSYEFHLIKRVADISLAEKRSCNIQDIIRDLIKKDMEEF